MALQTVRELITALQNGICDEKLSRIYGDGASRSAGRLLALVGGFCDFYGADDRTTAALFSCQRLRWISTCRESSAGSWPDTAWKIRRWS